VAATTPDAGSAVTLLPGGPALARLVFGRTGGWDLSLPDQRSMRWGFVREAFEHHVATNALYRDYVARVGAAAPEAPTDVPLVPTSLFKHATTQRVLSVLVGTQRCVSSGTQGSRSVIGRDDDTMELLVGSIATGLELIGDWYEHELDVVNLGPSLDEAGDVWFAYVMALVEMLFPTHHAVRDGHVDWAAAVDHAAECLDAGRHLGVIGPPFLVSEFADACARRGSLGGGDRVTVVTGGGWKGFHGSRLSRDELADRVADGLGLVYPSQVRDAFNQVELNTVVFECDALLKHVPAWLEVVARDPTTLEPLPEGRAGVLSYLDPTARSFPCFILGEDVGFATSGTCGCGRTGTILSVVRRIERAEAWGCAARLAEKWAVGR
jgi:long-chain-fatty-acid---luciferin-component ligase